ncbi:MAG: DUF2085 domain-containing protein [Chloroflexi bacterium]|nr:DUF2085 domain-containing protein [Chloroflexota bacterium]
MRDLKALQETIPHNLALVDIEHDRDLKQAFGHRVPVLQVGPYTLEAPFDRKKIHMTLAAARDRQTQLGDDPKFQQRKTRGASVSFVDRAGHWLSRRYLVLLNLLLFLYVGLPFLAPVLMNAGYPQAARPIYSLYGAVCHQLAFRSWFLFGEQPVYPRAVAGVEGFQTFEQATGIDEEGVSSLLDARSFIGNEQVGYKVAFCQRDVAIYGGMLIFGLIFAATRRRMRSLHWILWILIGCLPIALDGFSQLFSQIPGFDFVAFRESTPLLRTLTGFLFGFTTAWFGFPLLEESMTETRVIVATKKVRLTTNNPKSS